MSTETPAFSFDAHKLALKLKITLAAHPNLVDLVVESVMDQIRKARCATVKADAVELALTEALANAVVHGAKADSSKIVECDLMCDEAQHFGRAADVSVILVKLLQNVVTLVSRACLMQRGELISNCAAAAIAVYQRRQVLTLKAAGRRIHNDDALDHIAQFAHISRPGVAHKGLNSVITDLARSSAVGGGEFL